MVFPGNLVDFILAWIIATILIAIGVAILFGLEHHRIVVGVIAGLLYGLLLLRQKKLRGVVLAHAVTNFGLGVYVLATGNWAFW